MFVEESMSTATAQPCGEIWEDVIGHKLHDDHHLHIFDLHHSKEFIMNLRCYHLQEMDHSSTRQRDRH